MNAIELAARAVGSGHPMYVVAEIGLAPGKSLPKALALIDAAADAGADCAKFQTFTPEGVVSRHGRMASHFKGGSVVETFRDMEFPREHYPEVVERCRERKIAFMSSVFDDDALDFLQPFEPVGYKIAAFELGDRFLLERVSSLGKPMILSTGMASMADVERAVATVEASGNRQIVLMHTVSAYPAEPEDYNLRAMESLQQAFGYPTGVSDHTPTLEVPIAAAALGASIIEKHVTLDRSGDGPDDAFSLEPEMLADMVAAIRRTEAMLGDGRKRIVSSESDIRDRLRLALIAAGDLPAGTKLAREQLRIKRAGNGVTPELLELVEGRTLIAAVQEDEPLEWRHFMA